MKHLVRCKISFPFVCRVFQVDPSPNNDMLAIFRPKNGRAENFAPSSITTKKRPF